MALLALAVVLAQTPLCIPGTTACAESDGRGGVRVDASGRGQVGPNGANASGQAGAEAGATGNAQAAGQASGNYSGAGSYYRPSKGRSGRGVTLCPVVRAGLWSGLKAGGCVALGFRWDSAAFEMETQLLYGGVTHSFDWSFPVSLLVPLANEGSLFEGPYLRFGGSPVGATFARERDGGSFVRFGLFAGGGYELDVARAMAWRVFDLRFSLDAGTRRAMDDRHHWLDPGVQLATGLVL
jgi:hypothetical protein